jgi:hypothetical protein
MKQLENSEETRKVSVENIVCNISATSGSPIAIEGKWRPKVQQHGVACNRTKLDSLHGPYYVRPLPMGDLCRPTSDASVLSGANITHIPRVEAG